MVSTLSAESDVEPRGSQSFRRQENHHGKVRASTRSDVVLRGSQTFQTRRNPHGRARTFVTNLLQPVLSTFNQSKNTNSCSYHDVEAFISQLLPKTLAETRHAAQRREEAQKCLQQVKQDPRGHALLRAFDALYKILGQMPVIVLLEEALPAEHRNQKNWFRPSLSRPQLGNGVWCCYLSPTVPVRQVVAELAAVYNNMTRILEGADPFKRFLTEERLLPLSDKQAACLEQWRREAPLFSADAERREEIVRQIRHQFQRKRSYGSMGLTHLRALLKRIKEMPDSNPRYEILGMDLDLRRPASRNSERGGGVYCFTPPLSDEIDILCLGDFTLTKKSFLPKNTKMLTLENCEIDPKFSLSSIESLHTLRLKNCNLSRLKKNFFQKNIEVFELKNCEINPDLSLASFQSLHTLRLKNCDLTRLPKRFFSENIRVIELDNCKIFDMVKGEIVAKLPIWPAALKTLRITHCPAMQSITNGQIIELLSKVANSLMTLELSHNQLIQLPDDLLDQLKHLESLDVSGNQLAWIPSFSGASCLTKFNASHNLLTNLPSLNVGVLQSCEFDFRANPFPRSCFDNPIWQKFAYATKKGPRLLGPRLWNGYVISSPVSVEQAICLWLNPARHSKIIRLWSVIAQDMTDVQRRGFSDFLSYLHEQWQECEKNTALDSLRACLEGQGINVSMLERHIFDFGIVAWLINLSASYQYRIEERRAIFEACAAAQACRPVQERISFPLNNVMKFWVKLQIEQGVFDHQINRLVTSFLQQIFRIDTLCQSVLLQTEDKQYFLGFYEILFFLAYFVNDQLNLTQEQIYYPGPTTPLPRQTIHDVAQLVLKDERQLFVRWLACSELWQTLLRRREPEAYKVALQKKQARLLAALPAQLDAEWANIRGVLKGFLQQLQGELEKLTGKKQQPAPSFSGYRSLAEELFQEGWGDEFYAGPMASGVMTQENLAKAEIQRVLELMTRIKEHLFVEVRPIFKQHAEMAKIPFGGIQDIGETRETRAIQEFIASIDAQITRRRDEIEREIDAELFHPLTTLLLTKALVPD
jgi:Leucine-rich repeat (LRR) protein